MALSYSGLRAKCISSALWWDRTGKHLVGWNRIGLRRDWLTDWLTALLKHPGGVGSQWSPHLVSGHQADSLSSLSLLYSQGQHSPLWHWEDWHQHRHSSSQASHLPGWPQEPNSWCFSSAQPAVWPGFTRVLWWVVMSSPVNLRWQERRNYRARIPCGWEPAPPSSTSSAVASWRGETPACPLMIFTTRKYFTGEWKNYRWVQAPALTPNYKQLKWYNGALT